nr:hypothetical protein [Tanacetum cinerariifolium]
MKGLILPNMLDRWCWSLSGSGVFSLASVRNLIDDQFLQEIASKTRWIKAVPKKVNILAWRVKLDNLRTRTRRQATKVSRNIITRDRTRAHEHLVAAYFTESPMYDEKRFRQTFRMARPLFNQIVNAVTNQSAYFQSNPDYARREGIFPLIKCTSAIRQLAYGVNASFLDEYMQISERSSRLALDYFCEADMEIYGPEFLRKPTVTVVEKLYRHHEEKQGFPGML